MHGVVAPALRIRLLLGAWALAGCSGSCGGEPTGPRDVAGAALDYLATTEDELGLDVVVAIRIYGEQRGDPRALRVAATLRSGLGPRDLERYGRLLDAPLPTFPAASLDGVDPGPVPPDPAADLVDDRVRRCPMEVLDCRVDDACEDFVGLDDQGGYVLTHQALWLLFARSSGCETGIDLEARRLAIGARLLAETRSHPEASELHGERLAMLGHLGFASAIRPEWYDTLRALQRREGCFPLRAGGECHPHSTGVALWALAFAP